MKLAIHALITSLLFIANCHCYVKFRNLFCIHIENLSFFLEDLRFAVVDVDTFVLVEDDDHLDSIRLCDLVNDDARVSDAGVAKDDVGDGGAKFDDADESVEQIDEVAENDVDVVQH